MKAINYLKRIDKIQLLTSEWSFDLKNWSLSFMKIGIKHKWDGRSNYSTKNFAWISYYDKSWHFGLFFIKIK